MMDGLRITPTKTDLMNTSLRCNVPSSSFKPKTDLMGFDDKVELEEDVVIKVDLFVAVQDLKSLAHG